MKYLNTISLFCFVIISVLLNACSGRNAEDRCNSLLQKANDNLYQFYSSNDTLLLIEAKKQIDSIECDFFKHKVFNTKVALLVILNEYYEGVDYVKGLDSAEFDREYQKSMYLKSFEAMLCESKGDTVGSKNLYIEIADEIQSYLDKTAYREKEAVVDLFTIKSKVMSKSELMQEIDSLKNSGCCDNDFLESLAEILKSRDENGSVVATSDAIPVR